MWWDRSGLVATAVLVALIIFRTTIAPIAQLGFFGDDFAFLNWTSRLNLTYWLAGFFEPGNFNNLFYRPLAAVIYLVYLTGTPRFGYALLGLLFVANTLALFFLYRRLADPVIAAVALIIFTAGFIYFDATHKIYNLITQASALFFFGASHAFIGAQDPSRKGNKPAAYVLYTLSLLTYEITVFGFIVFFALALMRNQGSAERNQILLWLMQAVRSSRVFVTLSALFVIANLLSPIKAAHLREHAIPLTLSSVPVIVSRGWNVLKNTCAWIIAPLRSEPLDRILLDIPFLLALATVLCILISRSESFAEKDPTPQQNRRFLWLLAFGSLWFVAFLLPGSLSTYFDYRMTFLAYAGLSLSLAVAVRWIWLSASAGHSTFLRLATAVALATGTAVWLTANIGMGEKMNGSLIQAASQQRQILTALRPYAAALGSDSVLAIRYDHRPSRGLPYPYMRSPFAEDYALADAVEYYHGKKLNDASVFFQPGVGHFEIGRFAFARSRYPYGRLALFDFIDGGLELRQVISVGGEDIPLPLAVRLTAESRRQSKLAYR